jgi:hypothetical protein
LTLSLSWSNAPKPRPRPVIFLGAAFPTFSIFLNLFRFDRFQN